MGSITNYLETKLLDHTLNGVTYTPAATLYLALCTADPTDAATGASMNEVADSGAYARKAIAFGAAASRAIANNAQVSFDQATGSWGTVTHFAIVDSATHGAGNVLATGALSESKSVVSGNTPSVAIGEVEISFSAGEISDYLSVAWLDFAFRNQAFSSPSTYVGLTTATIGDSDTGSTVTEVSGGSYARKQVNVNGGASPTWDLAVSGDPSYVDNADAITLTTATASWGTATSMFIADAATAGNLLFYDNDMADQAIGTDDIVQFAAGALDVQVS
mgnify:CR=1 FL=1